MGLIDAIPVAHADAIPRKNAVISLVGFNGMGKSTLALTGPGEPIYFDLDHGNETSKQRIMDGSIAKKKPRIITIDAVTKEAALVASKQFFAIAKEAAAPTAPQRTLVVDTFDELRLMFKVAKFGLGSIQQHLWVDVNEDIIAFLMLFKSRVQVCNATLMLVSKLRKEQKTERNAEGKKETVWTGNYERAGFYNTGYFCDAEFQPEYNEADKKFYVRVNICKANPTLQGMRFTGIEATMPMLMTKVVPGTSPMDWGFMDLGDKFRTGQPILEA